MGHDLPGQIGITLVMPLGGIAFDDQILSFDVSQAAKLTEERAPCAPPASFRKKGSRDCRMENRYPAPRCRLLRPRRERPRRCAAEQRDELAPFPLTQLHPVPSGPGRHRRISDCSGSVSGVSNARWPLGFIETSSEVTALDDISLTYLLHRRWRVGPFQMTKALCNKLG
jgi:hypothetical protein